MSLLNFCIEVRTNLLCANVFLQFDQDLVDTSCVEICVENNVLLIKEPTAVTRIPFYGFFKVAENSLSNLVVGESHATFRLGISQVREEEFDVTIEAANEVLKFKPTIETNSETSIICIKCQHLLARNQKYTKVLEYPSGPIDLANFYCHHNPHYETVLVPKLFDFFYGFRFIILNADLLEYTANDMDGYLYCKRCTQYVGESVLSGRAVKLWTDYLLFKSTGITRTIWNPLTVKLPYLLLHRIESQTSFSPNDRFQFTKVLIETTFPNRKRKYLLLNLLEKNLHALRNSEHMKYSENPIINSSEIKLLGTRGFKVLYRLASEMPPLQEQLKIVSDWIEASNGGIVDEPRPRPPGYAALCDPLDFCDENMSIHCVDVSPRLFGELLYELDYNSNLLPEEQRKVANDFQLSYIFNSP